MPEVLANLVDAERSLCGATFRWQDCASPSDTLISRLYRETTKRLLSEWADKANANGNKDAVSALALPNGNKVCQRFNKGMCKGATCPNKQLHVCSGMLVRGRVCSGKSHNLATRNKRLQRK